MDTQKTVKHRVRVIVAGGGFGGLAAVRELAGQSVDVLWVDQNNYHLFQPLLYQVATGALDPETVAIPLRFCARKWPNVRVLLAEITEIDLAHRSLKADGRSYTYDYLILATGSTTNFFGNTEIALNAHDMKGLTMSLNLRAAVLRTLEQAAAEPPGTQPRPLEYAVVGAGPTGVEVAAALANLLRRQLRIDFPELDMARTGVSLLQAGHAILPTLPPTIQAYAHRVLESQGVTVRLQSRVQHFDGSTLTLDNGESLTPSLLIWTAGVQASPLTASLPVAKGPGGRIKVTTDLHIPDHPEVYVLGDLTYCPETTWPQNAPFARQSGVFAAHAILRISAGRLPPRPFRYRDLGSMVALRPFDATVYLPWLGHSTVRGLLGWLIWLLFHIGALVGFRSRVTALLDWGIDLVGRRPAAGLILSAEKTKSTKS